ncbi:response regulator [Candidatus Nitrospira salsa]
MDRVEPVSRNLGIEPLYYAPKCILIIDDDPLARSILRLLFETDGYLCKEAENGALGLAMLEQHQPDLVVTDHNMPILTGIEFLQRLGKKSREQVPAVIFMSGDSSRELKTLALQSGARAVLEKPYDIDEIRTLANWLLRSEQAIAFGAPSVN